MDIFLNHLIQFYTYNATKLHHLTTHSTTCWPTKWRSHCDHRYVASLHPCIRSATLSRISSGTRRSVIYGLFQTCSKNVFVRSIL